jgi:ABC-type polysaccharide/polyol phosphate export permease
VNQKVPSMSATRPGSSREQGGLWHYRILILNFAQRDLRARFKGTILGLAWSMALPLATLATYSIVFGVFLKQSGPKLGNGKSGPFPVFLFSGLVPFGMYSVTLSTAIASLINSGPLLKKIYFPPYASVFGSVAATFYQSTIEFGILVVALLAYRNIGWTWLLLPVWVVIFAIFVASISLGLAVLNVYLRDTSYVVSIALTLQFYLTPIIYPISQIPGSWHGIPLRGLITAQPLAVFVDVFRSLIYGLTAGSARSWLLMLFWTALAAGFAQLVYRRRGLDLAEEL